MRTWLLIICMGGIVSGCHSRNKEAHGVPVADSKQLKDMAGTWYATEGTHAMLNKKKYARDSIYIMLRPDSAFTVRLPDCLDAAAKGGLIWEAIGAWKLYKNGDEWKLRMAFEKGRLFRYRTITNFDIVIKDSALTLTRYIGDPDKEEVLEFRKSSR